MASPPRVVIVGGGQAGAGVAQALAGIADVTLVDPKDYLEIQYANVRVPVDPSIVEGSCVPFKDIPRLGRLVTSTATSVSSSARTLTTADGAAHPFDFLVLAPGVSYSDPLLKGDGSSASSSTLEARRRQVTEAAALLERARSVVVIGGGPVGVELAAEIADADDGAPAAAAGKGERKREITLVTSAEHLLHPKPAWVGAPAEAWLKSKGVRVVKGQKVEEKAAAGAKGGGDGKSGGRRKEKGAGTTATTTTLTTSPAGETLEADVVYWCFNGDPNTSFLSSSSVLDAAGFVQVDEHLRVRGKEAEGWFALGDASSAPGVKLGYLARAQASTVAANIKSAIRAAKEGKLRDPSALPAPPPAKWSANNGLEMMLVTLGKRGGTGHLGRWVRLPGLAVAAIKGGDLFVGKTRAGLGVA